MNPRAARGERLYRLLLRVYPRAFRERYAADMLAFYRDRAAEQGMTAIAALWMQLMPDLFATALAERLSWIHRDGERAPATVRLYATHREPLMSILVQDTRYALRGMLRRPAFAVVVIATLALGIGANAAIFTVVNGVLLRPLALGRPDRVVSFENGDPYGSVSEPEFIDYQRGVTAIEKLAAYSTPSIVIGGENVDPLRTYAARVSRDFFAVAGVQPRYGRVFAPEEFSPQSRARVVLLGHRIWTQQFGADPSVVGRTMNINGAPYTVIGVMPQGFTFPDAEAAVWTPWRLNTDSLWTRNNHYLRMVGLLGEHASLDQARSQATTLAARWMRDYPDMYMPDKPIRPAILPIRDALLGPTRPYLVALLGAVGFVLLIACVNVANLLLVRGDARRKELAIRLALGASRGRLARQMLTESIVFAATGALVGVGVAWVGTRALVALAPRDLPRVDEVGVDARVVIFTVAVTVLTGLAFGLLPAWRLGRSDSGDTLREGGKTSAAAGSGLMRRSLVVAEIALAVVMLAGAGLLMRSLARLQEVKLGFDPDHVMTMQVTQPPKKYTDTTADVLMRQLVARAAALPGVRAAGAVNDLPMSGNDNSWSILVDGRTGLTVAEAPGARPQVVTPDYFRAIGIRIVRGRGFTDQDRIDGALVAVVSEGMAKKLWPGVDPIGHTVRMFKSTDDWMTIVGVAADVRALGYQREIPPTLYVPYAQSARAAYVAPTSMTLTVRAVNDPASLAAPLRAVVRSLDPQLTVSQVETMDAIVGDSIASRRFTTALLGGFAALAVLLAGIGIYGVVSFGVAQRRYEIGVRMAMGASSGSIARLVLGESGRMTAIGLGAGLAGGIVVQRLLRSMLVGVHGADAPTYLGVCAVLATVAVCACLVPARRAMRVNPTEALRND